MSIRKFKFVTSVYLLFYNMLIQTCEIDDKICILYIAYVTSKKVFIRGLKEISQINIMIQILTQKFESILKRCILISKVITEYNHLKIQVIRYLITSVLNASVFRYDYNQTIYVMQSLCHVYAKHCHVPCESTLSPSFHRNKRL